MSTWRENPADVRPMLASLEEPPVGGRGLVYERKYDGIRAIVDVRPPSRGARAATVAIYSRNGREKHDQFPAITTALGAWGRTLRQPVVLDGEIVAIDAAGQPLGFQHVQGRIHLKTAADIAHAETVQPAALIVFDLLRDGDEDLRTRPLAERRLRLQRIFAPKGSARRVLRLSEIAADDGRQMLSRARRERWEGLIVKDGAAPYQSGRRTPAWRKLKLLKQQEFVIGGWTEPRESRAHFGALLVGYYDENGALRWAGSVGTGFDQQELDRLARLLRTRAVAASPFADRFKTAEPAHFIKPDLVAEVRFTEWTTDGLLRQPVYLGTREDKSAKDVRREDAQAPKSPAVPADGRYRRNRREVDVREADSKKVRDTAAVAPPSGPASDDPPAARRAGRSRKGAGLRLGDPATTELVAHLKKLEDARKDGDLALPDGVTLRVTNLAKVFWPRLGITKGELLRYYVTVSPYLLPVVADRPLVMKRFPSGVDKPAFYQQRHPDAVPPGVRRQTLPADIEPIDDEGPRDRLIGGSLATLIYMTQLAAISQDPWFSRVTSPLFEDYAAIDLDPGDGAGFDRVLEVARYVKDVLDEYGIPGWPKTSGASGLHIYIPLPPKTTYETGQLLSQVVATVVASRHPKVATVERFVKKRPRGTVYVDYLQNILGKTIASAYSARASAYAGVSMPLDWTEIAKGVDPRAFTIRTAPARLAERGDLWSGLGERRPVDLRAVLRRST